MSDEYAVKAVIVSDDREAADAWTVALNARDGAAGYDLRTGVKAFKEVEADLEEGAAVLLRLKDNMIVALFHPALEEL